MTRPCGVGRNPMAVATTTAQDGPLLGSASHDSAIAGVALGVGTGAGAFADGTADAHADSRATANPEVKTTRERRGHPMIAQTSR